VAAQTFLKFKLNILQASNDFLTCVKKDTTKEKEIFLKKKHEQQHRRYLISLTLTQPFMRVLAIKPHLGLLQISI